MLKTANPFAMITETSFSSAGESRIRQVQAIAPNA